MRIARFETPERQILTGRMVDEQTAQPLRGDLFNAPNFDAETVAISRLLAPIQPPNIFAIGRNYAAHIAETGAAAPEKPLIFMKPTTAVIGPGDPILLPAPAPDEVDFEAELVIVIGQTARNVSPAEALDYVLGYTCANDVSARDCQRNDKQWPRAKGFDTFCPLGPWIVTPDEIDPNDAQVTSRLNGETMQNASTAQMIHDCRNLISYVSHQFTLLPGTLILTGTPEGVGFARKPPIFLQAGDAIEIEVKGIGVLKNPVAAPNG